MTTKPRRRTVALVLLRTDTRGGHLVEYILLVGLVACLAMAAFRFLGHSAKVKAEAQGRCVASLACDGTSGGAQVAGDAAWGKTHPNLWNYWTTHAGEIRTH